MFGRLFRLSREEARRRASELLERFELTDAADRTAKTYSGGMRRRLDLASSLLTQPRVLFLDEPTTGLDPRSRNEIWQIVRDLRREGTTILLTTQYLEEADQLADKIAVIDHGRVIAEGTGDELKDRVGGQILEVELTDVRQRDEAEAALLRVGCGPPENDGRPNRLTLPAPRESLVLVEEAAAELRHAGIGVSDMGLRRPTLDDVFLQLTGEPPSENGKPRPAAAGPDEKLMEHPPRAPASACPIAARRGGGRHRHRRRDDAEPPPLLAAARPSRILDDPADHVRRPVRLRVRRCGRLSATAGSQLRRLSPAWDLRPVGDVPRVQHRGRPLRGPTPRRHRPLPFDADGAVGGPARANDRGPRPKHPDHRPDDRRRLPGRLPFQAGVIPALACVALVAAFGFALSWIFAFVSLVVRGAETAQTAGFVLLFPLVFASSVFVPISSMPSWLQPIAEASPVTLTADAARTLALTGGVPNSLWGSLAWIAGIVAVFVPLSVWRYRRMS